MKFAFWVEAHTDAYQIERLVKSLLEIGDVYIHIDAKTKDKSIKERLSEIKSYLHDSSQLSVYQCINVHWGGYSQVRCEKLLLQKAIIESGKDYDRVFILSGLDYLLYSPEKFRSFCEKHCNTEFVCGYNITKSNDQRQLSRIILYHYFRDIPLPHKSFLRRAIVGGCMLLLKYLGIRKHPYIVINGRYQNIYYGSNWVSLTGNCAKYVLGEMNTNKVLERYLSTAYAPDELIIPTIIFNSKFAANAILSSTPCFEHLTPLHYLHYTDHIWTYDEHDFADIMNSGKMFVRKLVSPKSNKLVEMIENFKDTVNS